MSYHNPFEPINERLTNLEALALEMLQLLRKTENNPATAPDDEAPLTIKQAAEFLNVSRQTIYQNIAKIPHRKRHGRLYFFKSELLDYLSKAV
ncbi:helix-turn-helix domain-containing protein [Spirosoma flavum]|uniref:Helix-turn-helix domain-containing protein n=1 Tax=Spirosoma flavum TaxID=2048557 RepID=A0ABW6ASS1_9BACT